jgi:type IV fimbrial biogenesis protein FimT
MPRTAGFTLIELLFVVALLAVLLSIGAPALQTMVTNNRISTAAGDLMADLMFARATAVSRSQRVGVCVSSDQATCSGSSWTQGWIVYMDANSNGNLDSGETIVRVREELAGALTVTPTPSTLAIVFRPSGPADASRTFQICKSGFKGRTIAINATGRPLSTPMASNCT